MSIRMELCYRESNPISSSNSDLVWLGKRGKDKARDQLFYWQKVEKPTGRGRNGQVKKADFFGRNISIGDQSFNRGSLIDFLNASVEAIKEEDPGSKLKEVEKGGVFFGGSSDEEIRKLFDTVKSEFIHHKTLLAKLKEPKAVSEFSSPVGPSSKQPFIGQTSLV